MLRTEGTFQFLGEIEKSSLNIRRRTEIPPRIKIQGSKLKPTFSQLGL